MVCCKIGRFLKLIVHLLALTQTHCVCDIQPGPPHVTLTVLLRQGELVHTR